eukprot:TRINITY_DN5339_c0_g1_i1.p4 TRINITY_DN5339_c0_g1~~TRINITY_DN5339_c0_g1_i1.p4  ORF type:complete len:165 (+),score=5.02 TRINITY_DN5339_c0_g1_i1:2967-3461(+)
MCSPLRSTAPTHTHTHTHTHHTLVISSLAHSQLELNDCKNMTPSSPAPTHPSLPLTESCSFVQLFPYNNHPPPLCPTHIVLVCLHTPPHLPLSHIPALSLPRQRLGVRHTRDLFGAANPRPLVCRWCPCDLFLREAALVACVCVCGEGVTIKFNVRPGNAEAFV